jgi:hypothetical protein
LYAAETGRHHVSFCNVVHGADQWALKRERAYVELGLPHEADDVRPRLPRVTASAAA